MQDTRSLLDKLKSRSIEAVYQKSAIDSKWSLRCNAVYLENEISHNISDFDWSSFIFCVCSTILILNNVVQVRNFYHE